MMKLFNPLAAAIFLILPIIVSAPAFSQSIGLGSQRGDITVTAAGGVEWNRNKQEIRINKEATMIQGDTKLIADVIVIGYTESGNRQEISLLTARGNVSIITLTEVLKGDEAVYNPNKEIAVLTGSNASLNMKDGTINARIFEYFKTESKAVARDGVTIIFPEATAKAVTAVAYLADEKKRTKTNSGISRLELFDNVVISTAGEIVKSDRGLYTPEKETIVLEGNVIIQKENNFLKGDIGEVNFKTGISRLRALPDKRVGGTMTPGKGKGK